MTASRRPSGLLRVDFPNLRPLTASDRQSAVKGKALIGAWEVRITPGTDLWQHEKAGAAVRRSRPGAANCQYQ